MESREWSLFCVLLLVNINMLQTKPIMKRILLKEVSQSHINPRPNRNTLYVRQRNRNCIDLGMRNTFCLINLAGGDYEYHKNVDRYPDIEEPGETFVDLTRLEDMARTKSDGHESFSEDYLDVNDLSITRKVDEDYLLDQLENHHFNILKLIVINTKTDHKSKYPKKQKSRKVFNVIDEGYGNTLRSRYSDSSDEGSIEQSSEDDDNGNGGHKIPKRYEVVENSEEDSKPSNSPEASSDELGLPARVQGRTKVIYAQSPTRHLSVLNRRRLPHFLPKRYHWSLDDIQHLPYLWFNGPQGRYPGIYRVTS